MKILKVIAVLLAILILLVCVVASMHSPTHLKWRNTPSTYTLINSRLHGTSLEVCSYITKNKITRADLELQARLLRDPSVAGELSVPCFDGSTIALQIDNPRQIAVIASNGQRITITIKGDEAPTINEDSQDESNAK
jgi:hypothetical protein